jgi:hypothetical protein
LLLNRLLFSQTAFPGNSCGPVKEKNQEKSFACAKGRFTGNLAGKTAYQNQSISRQQTKP